VSYGAEAWTLTKKEEQALLIFERKIFRRLYGPKYEKGEWKSRTNRELEEMSKGENIVKWIKWQRISWLGHLERMEDDRMSKKIFTQELEGTRRRGRPRKRWKEEVESDLQVLGVGRWRELVADMKKWKDIVRQAKAHSGLQCQWKKKKKKKKKSNLIRKWTKQIYLIHCVETVLEWRLIIMVWLVMPVDMFRRRLEICVTYRFENKLMRRITH